MRLLWITVFVIFIDQLTKVTVVEMMTRGQSIPVLGDWLKLTFTTNPGMAFGIEFGPTGMITIFSIVATVLIIGYLYRVRGKYAPYEMSLALILGGALGNIIDRVFYGMFFGERLMLPREFFHGQVVDFIHINVWRGYLPDAIPFFGGSYMALFPIWNVADMAIVVGVVGILFFQKKFHDRMSAAHEPAEDSDYTDTPETAIDREVHPTPPPPPDEPFPWPPPPHTDSDAAASTSNGQIAMTEDADREDEPNRDL